MENETTKPNDLGDDLKSRYESLNERLGSLKYAISELLNEAQAKLDDSNERCKELEKCEDERTAEYLPVEEACYNTIGFFICRLRDIKDQHQ